MKISKYLSLIALMALLNACGGGSDSDNCEGGSILATCDPVVDDTVDPADSNDVLIIPAIIEVITDDNVLPSDVNRDTKVRVTAIVSDADGAALADQRVTFSASNNGRLEVIAGGLTDDSGYAEADLNHGTDLSNRNIVVTALVSTPDQANAGSFVPLEASSQPIRVVNTKLELTGGTQILTAGESTDFTAILTDASGDPIPNYEITIISDSDNVITVEGEVVDVSSSPASTVFTDSSGSVNISVDGTNLGDDTVTVMAAGEDKEADFQVTNDVFQFDTPNSGKEVEIGASQTILFIWEEGGPVVGSSIQFTATRGTISGGDGCGGATPCATDTTNGAGIAQVTINSTDAGPATVVATDPVTGQTNSLSIEFIATTPDTLTLKTEKTRVDVGESTNLIAQVKDPSGNPVKNSLVNFSALIDVTNGEVFPATATTDSNGEARSVYTGGDTPSATDGVQIYAEVDSDSAINGTVSLTVAGVARDVTIGTGNTLFEIGTAAYGKEYIVIVKDGVGNPKPNALVEVSMISQQFRKGYMRLSDPTDPFEALLSDWIAEITDTCDNEDGSITGVVDGIIDLGEDLNSNGTLEPGNVGVVAAVDPNADPAAPCTFGGFSQSTQAADVTTNANGLARVCVYYPQSYALWLSAEIEARTQVSGTEFGDSETFFLEVLSDDVSDSAISPPNDESPYGLTAGCDNDL